MKAPPKKTLAQKIAERAEEAERRKQAALEKVAVSAPISPIDSIAPLFLSHVFFKYLLDTSLAFLAHSRERDRGGEV